VASLRRKGEARVLNLSGTTPKHVTLVVWNSVGGWGEKVGKAHQLSIEVLLGATESGEEVRAPIVAMKRVMTVEPRGVGR